MYVHNMYNNKGYISIGLTGRRLLLATMLTTKEKSEAIFMNIKLFEMLFSITYLKVIEINETYPFRYICSYILRNITKSETQKRAYCLKTFAKRCNSPFRTLKLLK